MQQMKLKSILIIAALIIFIFAGVNMYIKSTTTIHYGAIPTEKIPRTPNQVTCTIPTIDAEGNRSTHTLTIDKEWEEGLIIKLIVRKDKVQKYKLIKMDDVPENIKRNLSIATFE